jgi:uracil-DNA glycosylase
MVFCLLETLQIIQIFSSLPIFLGGGMSLSEGQTQLFKLYSERMFDSIFLPTDHTGKTQLVSCYQCKNRELCQVKPDQPIYTGYLGDSESRILVIGEAPSMSGSTRSMKSIFRGNYSPEYTQAHINEDTQNIEKGWNSPYPLMKYIKDFGGEGLWPYFTDLIKCGCRKQDGEKKTILDLREETCFMHILIEELRILKPKIIICCHSRSHRVMSDYLKHNRIGFNSTVILAYHYSNAVRYFSLEDKIKSIWPIQTGFSRPQEDHPRGMNIRVSKVQYE